MVCGGLVGPCTPWNIYHTLQLLIIVTFPPLIAYLLGRIRGRRFVR